MNAFQAILVVILVSVFSQQTMAEPAVVLTAEFPGGNVRVIENSGDAVQIAPDFGRGLPWFYWYFEAESLRPGQVTFVLPEKMPGFSTPPIGMRGPVLSLDNGKSWSYMDSSQFEANMFRYNFSEVGQKVRFAVTLPYVQDNLDHFLEEHKENPYLQRTVLTKSLQGRTVDLLQIGKATRGVKPILMTARHHANESIASFVLEGFLRGALADSPAGQRFRSKYVLYVVPIVDKDGVENGDQGKNRYPHDHNRDYGEGSLYPEVDAIENIANDKEIRFLLDFHNPTLRAEEHQVLYFVGTKQSPKNNFQNVEELAWLIEKHVPNGSPAGPVVRLEYREPMPTGSNCNRYFSFREGTIMAATLETPFSPPQPSKLVDATLARGIGNAVFLAWSEATFAE